MFSKNNFGYRFKYRVECIPESIRVENINIDFIHIKKKNSVVVLSLKQENNKKNKKLSSAALLSAPDIFGFLSGPLEIINNKCRTPHLVLIHAISE